MTWSQQPDYTRSIHNTATKTMLWWQIITNSHQLYHLLFLCVEGYLRDYSWVSIRGRACVGCVGLLGHKFPIYILRVVPHDPIPLVKPGFRSVHPNDTTGIMPIKSVSFTYQTINALRGQNLVNTHEKFQHLSTLADEIIPGILNSKRHWSILSHKTDGHLIKPEIQNWKVSPFTKIVHGEYDNMIFSDV